MKKKQEFKGDYPFECPIPVPAMKFPLILMEPQDFTRKTEETIEIAGISARSNCPMH